MLAIAYHFHVLPRYQDQFQHAWRAARDSLEQALGLVSFELNHPRDKRQAFTLMLAWDNQSSFERFTRTWVGVWMLNGMGLGREAFAAPIQTDIGEEEFAPRVGKRAA
ncbi:MAG: antibiotic biosynthesis monooxygenase [Pseudomonadota bacterium]